MVGVETVTKYIDHHACIFNFKNEETWIIWHVASMGQRKKSEYDDKEKKKIVKLSYFFTELNTIFLSFSFNTNINIFLHADFIAKILTYMFSRLP